MPDLPYFKLWLLAATILFGKYVVAPVFAMLMHGPLVCIFC